MLKLHSNFAALTVQHLSPTMYKLRYVIVKYLLA